MSSLNNEIYLAINRALLNSGFTKQGVITNSNPNNGQVQVQLQPEGTVTGYIPYATPWVGKGFGFYAPPVAGTQVAVFFQEGNKDVPIGAGSLYWVQAQPPAGVALGEAILMHKSGSFVKFNNDESITISTEENLNVITGGDLDATVTGDVNITASTGSITLTSPTINLNGDVVISGNLSSNDGELTMDGGNLVTSGTIQATGEITGAGVALSTHVHGGVTTGSDDTGEPA